MFREPLRCRMRCPSRDPSDFATCRFSWVMGSDSNEKPPLSTKNSLLRPGIFCVIARRSESSLVRNLSAHEGWKSRVKSLAQFGRHEGTQVITLSEHPIPDARNKIIDRITKPPRNHCQNGTQNPPPAAQPLK